MKSRGGGMGVLFASVFRSDTKSGGGGVCLPYDDTMISIFVFVRVHDSAWGVEGGGGGGNWCQRAALHMNRAGCGCPPPPPKPMLDPGLVSVCVFVWVCVLMCVYAYVCVRVCMCVCGWVDVCCLIRG